MLSYCLSKFYPSLIVGYAKIISKGKDANGSKNEEMCTRTQRINSNVFVLQTQIMNESKFECFRVYCICACWNIVWILNNNITFDIQPGDDIPLSLSLSFSKDFEFSICSRNECDVFVCVCEIIWWSKDSVNDIVWRKYFIAYQRIRLTLWNKNN